MVDYDEVFRHSFQRVSAAERSGFSFFDEFYRLFIGSSREIEEKFNGTDMGRQKRMLARSMYQMLQFYLGREASEKMAEIAGRHARRAKNIEPGLYERWLECLVETVRSYDDDFDDDVELAWRVVMAPGIAYMKFRYDHDPPPATSRQGRSL